ncbi:MAG: phosphatidylserine decarboxylase [Defluviitaleaceae bacterium]|nr:phosphatidylserine decarboxylase [Defluviitaleaceae bacterium]MCL2275644.1 phosphatidylserine decarboxylase [Defluviitaleaceae bacterium]
MIYDNGTIKPEKIIAEKWLRLIYDDGASPSLARLASRKLLSRLYGAYCQTPHSRQMIGKFIADNNIDMTGCVGSYENFAQFFAREKRGIVFPAAGHLLGSPCEGLASAYENINPARIIAAKGAEYSLGSLFGSATLAAQYAGGACLRVRLTPANYHRMHFFDDGEITGVKCIDGDLHSVNPLAVAKIARLYCQNKRVRVQATTKNFGDIVIVEVGATFVGSIVHRFLVGDNARRGQQASYFLPGGSLVLVFFKQGTIKLDENIITLTREGIETRVNVGEVVGQASL